MDKAEWPEAPRTENGTEYHLFENEAGRHFSLRTKLCISDGTAMASLSEAMNDLNLVCGGIIWRTEPGAEHHEDLEGNDGWFAYARGTQIVAPLVTKAMINCGPRGCNG